MARTSRLVPIGAGGQLPQGLTVLHEPNFIIEKDGELYLTVGLLKYSDREAEAEPDPGRKQKKKEGVARVRQMFNDGINSPHTNLDCTEVLGGDGPLGMNTEPPGMNTSP